jgi:hypothetical protein
MLSMTIEKSTPDTEYDATPASHEQVAEELGDSREWWLDNRNEIAAEAGLQEIAIAPEDTHDRVKRPGCDFAFECRGVIEGRSRVWLASGAQVLLAIVERAAKRAKKIAVAFAPMTRTAEAKTRPNDRCPCSSGKKYKKCCGR